MALLFDEETSESSVALSPVELELAGSTFLTQKLKFRDYLPRAADSPPCPRQAKAGARSPPLSELSLQVAAPPRSPARATPP